MDIALRSPGSDEVVRLAVGADGRWSDPTGAEPAIGIGLWALAGLVDCHSHLASDELTLEPGDPVAIARRAFACLDRGTFLVVDKGWSDNSVMLALTTASPADVPEFEGAGRMVAVPDGYYPGFAVETDPVGLAAVVEDAVAQGRGWVKLVGDWPRRGQGALANFSPDELATAVRVAHDGGARVAIHTMAPAVASTAVAAGVDSIEHGLFLTRQDLVDLGGRGGAWVPTVRRVEAIASMLGPDSSGGRLMRDGLDNIADLFQSVPSGVAVLAGTDLATRPGDVGREVAGLVARGLAPDRALDAATSTARRYLGRPPAFQPGDWANAVFYRSDPLLDPAVLSHPDQVMYRGTLR